MSDLISRQAAIDALEKIPVREFKKTDGLLDALISIGQVYMALKQLPSAQPERKKGKWMPLQLSMAHPPYQCSCCFRNAPMVETGCLANRCFEALLTPYCPNCGADMRGEQDGLW